MTTTTTPRPRVVVSLDIETLGLLPPLDEPATTPNAITITCVCLYDTLHGGTSVRLYGDDLDPDERTRRVAGLVDALDAADAITGFNVVAFDLECLRRAFGLSSDRMAAWCAKSLDPLVVLRLLTHTTASLQALLALNGIAEPKLATGLDAIQMAHRGEWDALLAYCAEDARLAFVLVCERDWLVLTPGLECCLLATPVRFRARFASSSLSSIRPPPPPSLRALLLPDEAAERAAAVACPHTHDADEE
jgi:hypothetical protein